jgi:hypothetical protein
MREIVADRRTDAGAAEVAVTRALKSLRQGGHLVFDGPGPRSSGG